MEKNLSLVADQEKAPHVGDPTFDALTSDFDKCVDHLEAEDTQFWRRTICRTIFSMFEAMNGLLREKAVEALCSADKKSRNITRIELLSGNEWRILKDGKLEQQRLRRPFLNYTAFILRAFAEESNSEPTFFADSGWNDFQKAVEVRHRLTHPKKNTDMNVSDAELTSLHEAVRWYCNAAATVLNNKTFWKGPTIPAFPG
jgi:hypothetical protein